VPRLAANRLVVPPFAIARGRQVFVSEHELTIDLSLVEPGSYRVLAVHNFHVEDVSPDLDRCVAGIFLAARRADGAWEEPERFPVECRALETLCVVDVDPGGVVLRRSSAS
jgi:hypothetical protein